MNFNATKRNIRPKIIQLRSPPGMKPIINFSHTSGISVWQFFLGWFKLIWVDKNCRITKKCLFYEPDLWLDFTLLIKSILHSKWQKDKLYNQTFTTIVILSTDWNDINWPQQSLWSPPSQSTTWKACSVRRQPRKSRATGKPSEKTEHSVLG